MLLRLNVELVGKNQELDAIVSTAPDMIFSSQEDGGYEYVSDRFHEYAGTSAGSGYNVRWLDYVHSEDADRIKMSWAECVKAGGSF